VLLRPQVRAAFDPGANPPPNPFADDNPYRQY
jgi:hypothetical protein